MFWFTNNIAIYSDISYWSLGTYCFMFNRKEVEKRLQGELTGRRLICRILKLQDNNVGKEVKVYYE